MSKLGKTLLWVLSIIAGISLLFGLWVVYYISNNRVPETLGTTYLDLLPIEEGDVPICTVNIFDNSKNSGQKLYEVIFNGYTDVENKAVKGYGIQVVGDYDLINRKSSCSFEEYLELENRMETEGYLEIGGTGLVGSVYTYNSDDLGISSYLGEMPTKLFVQIDGTNYLMEFEDYSYKVPKGSNAFTKAFNELFGRYKNAYASYTFLDLFDLIVQSALSNSAQEDFAQFSIPMLDCSEMIRLRVLNEDGQYVDLDSTSMDYDFLKVHINYSKDGALNASESLFHQVANESSWSYFNSFETEDYWNSYSVVTITETDVCFVESTYYEGQYYIALTEEYADYLNTLTNVEINVDINLDNISREICGIDMTNFNFDFDNFTITSSDTQTFDVINSSGFIPELSVQGGVA